MELMARPRLGHYGFVLVDDAVLVMRQPVLCCCGRVYDLGPLVVRHNAWRASCCGRLTGSTATGRDYAAVDKRTGRVR